MSLDDFKKILRGVELNNDENFDTNAFLAEIYETVEKEPFTLDEDDDARLK